MADDRRERGNWHVRCAMGLMSDHSRFVDEWMWLFALNLPATPADVFLRFQVAGAAPLPWVDGVAGQTRGRVFDQVAWLSLEKHASRGGDADLRVSALCGE